MKNWPFPASAAEYEQSRDLIKEKVHAVESDALARIRNAGSLDQVSIVDLLDVICPHGTVLLVTLLSKAGGCSIGKQNEFNAWCEANDVFDVLSMEYVKNLAKYLKERAHQISPTGSSIVTVVAFRFE